MFSEIFRYEFSLRNNIILLFLCVNHLDAGHSDTCGYAAGCPALQKGMLNVHIVPHTHTDVGWVRTANEYYSGSGEKSKGVRGILDSVVKELLANRDRRFVYAETYFFWRWWMDRTEDFRDSVRMLVKQGRLQFVGGAWSMNDEAATHYQSIIDQFTLGLSKLNQTFGKCGMPKVGWQIDPFGHSREFASLLAGMGYQGLFLGRIDVQDRNLRLKNKQMEMLWRGNDDLGKTSDIFTGVLYNSYNSPEGFCFDEKCGDISEMNDDNHLNNVLVKVAQFMKICKTISDGFITKNILIPMGGDFHYENGSKAFKNLDKLIKHTNEKAQKNRVSLRLMYSTPYCYLKAVKDANPPLPVKQDDFFPYANERSSYWTGFYTSRPTIKYLEREANSYLQMAKQLQVLGDLKKLNMQFLDQLKSAVGVMQHHDAITGTEKQYVADDYVRTLHQAIEDSLRIPGETFNKVMQRNKVKTHLFEFSRCRLNESSCPISEDNHQFIVTVYNLLGWHVNTSVRVPVRLRTYSVYGPNGAEIETQLVEIPQAVIKIPTRESYATHEIVFVVNLDPLSYKSFYILTINAREPEAVVKYPRRPAKVNIKQKGVRRPLKSLTHCEKTFITNEYIRLGMNESSGQIFKAIFPDWAESNLKINFYRYSSSEDEEPRRPGAYIMKTESKPTETELRYVKGPIGPVFEELRSISTDKVASTIRLYKGLNYIEHDWVIGPIISGKGREYVVRYITDICSKGTFFTDSNGRQMIKRKVNQRPQWNVTIEDNVAGNYYPVTNQIFIQDDVVKAIVLTDRSEGGTSLDSGHIELMLHRRLFQDDGFGVDEPLNEIANNKGLVARGTHRLYISKVEDENAQIEEKKHVLEFHLRPQILISGTDLKIKNWLKLDNSYSWMNPLPLGVHLLTLEPWGDHQLLLRLENYLELFETVKSTISINLRTIFKTLKVDSFKETTLAANYWVGDHERWNWKTKESFSKSFNQAYGGGEPDHWSDPRKEVLKTRRDEGFIIWLRPKEIRTFVVNFRYARQNSRRAQTKEKVTRKKSVVVKNKNVTRNGVVRRFISWNSCNHGRDYPTRHYRR